MKKVFSFRLDEKTVQLIRAGGLDLAKMIEAMMERVIDKKKCPCCKQVIKG